MTHLREQSRVSGSSIVLGGNGATTLPTSANGWPLRPFQIVSLLEMLKEYAAAFYSIGQLLEALVRDQRYGDAELSEEHKKTITDYLDILIRNCTEVGLDMAAVAIERLKKTPPNTYTDFQVIFPEIQRRIEDQLMMRRFLYIPAEHVSYYEAKALFGDVAAQKFHRINNDLEEAGKCMATGRYTACVFHLMRVMEVLVQTLGKKLHVTLTTEKVWQNILDEVNRAIRQMPSTTRHAKAKQSAYAEVSAHLFTVKVAWRNPVMHPKATYTPEEAEDVFRSVKAFTTHFSLIV